MPRHGGQGDAFGGGGGDRLDTASERTCSAPDDDERGYRFQRTSGRLDVTSLGGGRRKRWLAFNEASFCRLWQANGQRNERPFS